MRAVWQRVSEASVSVKGKVVSRIARGALVLLGVGDGDAEKDIKYIADKCVNLRLFEDERGRFNYSVKDIEGSILLVSQFTLYGDCRRGRRPSFSGAARPEVAETVYMKVADAIEQQGVEVKTGIFQTDMKVSLVNDGPVTVILDSSKEF